MYPATAPRPGFLVGFYCAILTLVTNDVSADLLPVTTDPLLSHLKNGFSERRSYLQPTQKDAARKYVKEFLQNLALNHSTDVIEHLFGFPGPISETDNSCVPSCIGVNFLWILPGTRYGTTQDEVHLLGAHYDSQTDTPGVDDDGSGMAAMLETVRVLSQSELDCDRLNSVVFAAFDWEEFGLVGSQVFLQQIAFLTKNITEDNFAGAVILDTIMNWNESENSQTLPEGYNTVFPDFYAHLKKDSFRGNNLNIIQRIDDRALGNGLAAVWDDLADDKYGIANLELPAEASGQVSSWPNQTMQAFAELLNDDHHYFWDALTTDGKGLKATLLTDSGYYRGVMMDCYHNPCDNLDNVTPKKLEFLAKTTEMLVRYFLEQTTEKTATECGGKPQENWGIDTSRCPPDTSSSPPDTSSSPPDTSSSPPFGSSLVLLAAVAGLLIAVNKGPYC